MSVQIGQAALGGTRSSYRAWHKQHRDRPGWEAIEAAAKRLDVTYRDLTRAAQIYNDFGLPPLDALKDALAESAAPVPEPTTEILQEHWAEEFDHVLSVLMRNAHRLPDRRPFGPDGYRRLVAEDPTLPSYAHLLYTARRHGFTPLQLRDYANSLLGKGMAPPEPRLRELVAGQDSAPLGTAAIDDVLRRPFTPADLRAATMTWPLHEVFDAMVDALTDLPEGSEFGANGWKKISRGRRDLPTHPTFLKVARTHGLSCAQLLEAAKAARAEGRHLSRNRSDNPT